MILESVEHGPLIWPTVKENGVTTIKKYVELSAADKIQADCDMKATNVILQGLPPKWSKFVIGVKIVKDLHTTNIDQLHAYLEQHELHANEVRLLRKRNQDSLAFVANQQITPPHFNTYQSSYYNPQLQQQFSPSQASQYGPIHHPQHYSSTYPSPPQRNHSFVPPSHTYQSQMSHQTSSVPQSTYQLPQAPTQPMTELPLADSCLAILVFSLEDDLIAYLNKAMAFLTAVASTRGDKGKSYSSTGYKSNATSSRGSNASRLVRVVKCYNYQGKGHIAKQCTQPKRPRNATWYKDKVMLAEAQEAGQILDEEQLTFLANLGIPDGQAVQTIIPNNAAF
ncbi:hypothetical protein Tco_1348034 [Tanacetum coccineum]